MQIFKQNSVEEDSPNVFYCVGIHERVIYNAVLYTEIILYGKQYTYYREVVDFPTYTLCVQSLEDEF